jgi:phospholipase/carboxylesterase
MKALIASFNILFPHPDLKRKFAIQHFLHFSILIFLIKRINNLIQAMHQKKIVWRGKKIDEANKVLIMLHGRGATAEDILSLSSYLDTSEFALLAPQATNQTWYPFSFMAHPAQNEPWLSSAIKLLDEIVSDLINQKIASENIYFLGFSQGACLTLEYTTRFARKWGGVIAFTGGLIGDRIYEENYLGDFEGTPVFIGSSDPDPHVPTDRVRATTKVLEDMKAIVTTKLYPGMGHTINQDEMDMASRILSANQFKV